MDIEEALKAVRDVYINFPKLHTELQEELTRIDDEAQDLLHLIELTNCNAYEGFKLYKDLQRNRKERRIVKDRIELLGPVMEINKYGKPAHKNINRCIEDVQRVQEKHGCRTYRMRVRTELQGKLL